jgi:WD40 repeat protein
MNVAAAQSDAVPDTPLFPCRIPDHEILHRIGYGSYGEVWLARNMMGTYRAVKFVALHGVEQTRGRERELAGLEKFEPISRSHEGFVDILQLGQNEKYFYYIMELADDQETGQVINPEHYVPKTLAQEIRTRGRLPFDQCLQSGLSLSSALKTLHQHGLIHRDIKPSNIIYVNGVPKLADIGLVIDINKANSYVGTEGFIPPEGPRSPLADIYGLGKVLYEMSTGRDRNDFPSLSELQDTPDMAHFRELNEVLLKACQNDSAKRYQSAADLYSDLQLLQQGKSVRRLRVLERQRILFAKAAVVAVIGVLVYMYISRQRHQAAEARQRHVGGLMAQAAYAMDHGDLLGTLPPLVEALRLDQRDGERQQNHRRSLAAVLDQSPRLTHVWSQDGRMNSVDFSADGKSVLTALWWGKARVWNLVSGQALSPAFGPERLEMARFSPDGSAVVTASQDKTARVWDAVKWTQKLILKHPAWVFSASFSPDGRHIVTACEDGSARVWDAATGVLEKELKGHQAGLLYVAFSRNGQLIVTCSKDRTARIWEFASGRSTELALKHLNWVYYASFSPDDRCVATASFDRQARVWDIRSCREMVPAMSHPDGVRSVEFSPDSRYLVTACLDSTARLWDAISGQPLSPNPILYHNDRVMHATFSPDGRSVITASADGVTRVWDMSKGTVLPHRMDDFLGADSSGLFFRSNDCIQCFDAIARRPTGPKFTITCPVRLMDVSRNAGYVLTVSPAAQLSQGDELRISTITDGRPAFPPLIFTNALEGAALSDDGTYFASFARKVAQIYRVETGSPVSPPLVHARDVTKAAFNRNGRNLLTVSGRTVQVWDLATAKLLFPALRHAAGVSHAEFSPCGRYLVTCAADDNLNPHCGQVRDAFTGRTVGSALQHRDGVLYASFSPDSQRVVTAGEDFTAIVWEVATGKQLLPSLRHDDRVLEASFSSNGRWIVTACNDKTVRIWDAQTGRPLTPRLPHTSPISHARFIGNDQCVLSADRSGAAWLWDLPEDNRTPSDLAAFAEILSGSEQYQTVLAKPYSQGGLLNLWEASKAKYGAEFSASREKILAWHYRAAEQSEQKHLWFAAVFHLNQLLTLEPRNQALRLRLRDAEENFANEH